MKRFCKIIVLFLVLFSLCACQASATEVVPEYDSSIQGNDLGGFEMFWGFSKSNDNPENVLGYIPDTEFADLAATRLNEVQQNLNCKIDIAYNSYGNIYNNMHAYMASGERGYDVITNETYLILSSIRGGYFTGLSSLLDVQNTDKWGTPNLLQSVLWKDDLYAVVPFSWPELLYSSICFPIVVNEDIVSKIGQTDPREYLEDDTWTWDTLEEILLSYTFSEGDRKVYGMATYEAYFPTMMFLSNGDTITEYTDEGIVCGIYSDTAYASMERAQKIMRETCKDCFHPDVSPEGSTEAFKKEEAVMLTAPFGRLIGNSDSLMYYMDNLAILPYPLGPNATPGVYTSCYETLVYATAIPVNSTDPAAVAEILEGIYEPLPGYETFDDIAEYMMRQIFFDERDADIVINMLKNIEYGFYAEGARVALEELLSGKSISSILESRVPTYEVLLEEILKPHYEARIAVYGE